MSLNKEIKLFVLKNYLFTEDESVLSDGDSLMQKGIIDSTGILELVNHIEDTYKLKVADDEMIPDNLDSISKIASFIERRRSA